MKWYERGRGPDGEHRSEYEQAGTLEPGPVRGQPEEDRPMEQVHAVADPPEVLEGGNREDDLHRPWREGGPDDDQRDERVHGEPAPVQPDGVDRDHQTSATSGRGSASGPAGEHAAEAAPGGESTAEDDDGCGGPDQQLDGPGIGPVVRHGRPARG